MSEKEILKSTKVKIDTDLINKEETMDDFDRECIAVLILGTTMAISLVAGFWIAKLIYG